MTRDFVFLVVAVLVFLIARAATTGDRVREVLDRHAAAEALMPHPGMPAGEPWPTPGWAQDCGCIHLTDPIDWLPCTRHHALWQQTRTP